MAGTPHRGNATTPVGSGDDRDHDYDQSAKRRGGTISRARRSIRATPPAYRWECPCQDPPVLLATYGPDGRMNIKVRDRYWHLYGFGQVQAICPRCAGEHVLDLSLLHRALNGTSEDQLALDFDAGSG